MNFTPNRVLMSWHPDRPIRWHYLHLPTLLIVDTNHLGLEKNIGSKYGYLPVSDIQKLAWVFEMIGSENLCRVIHCQVPILS